MKTYIYILLFFTTFFCGFSQSTTVTYNAGNIRTGQNNWPGDNVGNGSCPSFTLIANIPAGSLVTGVDVSYDFQARNGGWMSDQRSQIYCQETNNDEGGFILGTGDTGGTQTYNRTNLTLANGISVSGTLTFEMRAFRTWSGQNSNEQGCRARNNRIRNNTWTITVYYKEIAGGYTGPGGVGQADGSSALELWLDANQNITGTTPISAWGDSSGNSITTTIVGDPELATSSVNTLDAVAFDGFQDIITTNLSINHAVMPSVSILSVYKPNNSDPGGVWGEDNLGWDRFILNKPSNSSLFDRIVSNGSAIVSNNIGDIFPVNSYVSTTVLYNQGTTNGTEVYADEDLERSFTSNQSGTSDDFIIGSIDRRENVFEFNGDIGEVIVYSKKLTDVERIIINNYLSAKYNIPLSQNNFYNEDENGDFDFDVAGIGQASDGTPHTDSQGTGIIRINTPSSLSNDDYLFWGRNTKGTINFTSSTTYTERLNTTWRISKTNNLGTVTFQIDITGIDITGKQACAPLRLVIDNDSDFSSPTQVINLTNTSGNIYQANGVNFSDNDYFSIEYVDQIVLDGTTFYNGSGTGNSPNTSDSCYKLLVTSSTTGATALSENAHVREVEVEAGGNLAITNDNYLEIDNGLELNGDIRLVGNAQIIQNHTGTSQVTGSGKLYIDQKSNINTTNSVYRYTYWSSPVVENSGDTSYAVGDVMKDGSTATTATGSSSEAQNINWLTYGGTLANLNGDPTPPISIANYWIYTYKEGIDNSGFSQQLHTGSIPVGQGYLMKGSGNASGQNFTFSGIPNDGVINIPISTSETNTIIGNPYPSAINANQFMDDNAGAIKQELYFWQHQGETSAATITEGHTQSGYIGGYTVLNRTMGVGATQPSLNSGGIGGSTYDPPGAYIPVGQGFLVTAENTGNIVFQNSQREYQALRGDGGDSFFFGSPPPQENTESQYPKLRIGFEHTNQYNVELHRQIGVGFIDGLSFNYESGYDSRIYDTRFTDIYWKFPNDDNSYIITGVQQFEKNLQIPLEIRIQEDQPVKFMIDSKENFPSDTEIFLKDTANDEFYNLSNTIELNLPEGIYTDRFFITFSSNSSLSNEDVLSNNVNIYFKKLTQELVITTQNNITFKNVKLYDILGKEIKNWQNLTPQNKTLKLPISNLATAIYLVSIETQEGFVAKKIIL